VLLNLQLHGKIGTCIFIIIICSSSTELVELVVVVVVVVARRPQHNIQLLEIINSVEI